MEGKRGLIYMLLKSMLPLGVPFLKNFVTVTSWLGGGVSLPFLLSFGNLITKKQKVGFLGKVRSFESNGQRRNITSSIPFTFYWNIFCLVPCRKSGISQSSSLSQFSVLWVFLRCA